MGVFSTGGVGIDAGSANITICLENEGVVLREPSYVLTLRDDPDEILAFGRDARQMLGRTPQDAALRAPIQYGAVADVHMATSLMRDLADKALGKRRALERNRIVVSCSTGCTRVEREAMQEAVNALGAKRAFIAHSAVAAAGGAGVPMEQPKGSMLVSIGSATTEVSVLSMNGIVATRTVRTGSTAIDEAIVRFIRYNKNLIIGQRTAEDMKIDLGSAVLMEGQPELVSLRGRNATTGKPATVDVSSTEICLAIRQPLEMLLENIQNAFENVPAEIGEDVLREGIYLTGGGALLEGLGKSLGEMLNMRVNMGETPQDDAAVGACTIAANERLLQKLIQSGCVAEI